MERNYLRPVQKIIPVSGDLTILLLKREGPLQGVDSNLICCDEAGNQLWRCTPPGRPDYFTDVELVEGALLAYAWSGHSCHIDPATGNIRDSIFVK